MSTLEQHVSTAFPPPPAPRAPSGSPFLSDPVECVMQAGTRQPRWRLVVGQVGGWGPGPLPHGLVRLVPHRMCASTPTACLSTCGRKSLSPSTSLSTSSTSSTPRRSSKARSHRCRSAGLMCTGEDGGGGLGLRSPPHFTDDQTEAPCRRAHSRSVCLL